MQWRGGCFEILGLIASLSWSDWHRVAREILAVALPVEGQQNCSFEHF